MASFDSVNLIKILDCGSFSDLTLTAVTSCHQTASRANWPCVQITFGSMHYTSTIIAKIPNKFEVDKSTRPFNDEKSRLKLFYVSFN